jgi:hypothetical protein
MARGFSQWNPTSSTEGNILDGIKAGAVIREVPQGRLKLLLMFVCGDRPSFSFPSCCLARLYLCVYLRVCQLPNPVALPGYNVHP